jgi:hypothetical protein
VHVEDGIQGDEVIASVLDVDEQVLSAAGADVSDGSELLVATLGEDLKTDANAPVRL